MSGIWSQGLGQLARSGARVSRLIAIGAVLLVAWGGRAAAQYVEPVDAPVVDGYRPPEHFGGPGNRGWEYFTAPGSPIRASANGVVRFAGPIGSSLYVSIVHPDGLRTTYSRVASIEVRRGDHVAAGAIVATALSTFHFGVVDHGDYLDPAVLFNDRTSHGPGPDNDALSDRAGASAVLVQRGNVATAVRANMGGVGVSRRYQ